MLKIYRCDKCGNVVAELHHGGGVLACCGQPMTLLEANTTEAAQEKHVPAVTVDGAVVTVKVGSVEHPMTPEHFITTIALETDGSVLLKELTPDDKPEAVFTVPAGEKAVAAYEYCTLHGLWKAEL